MKEKFSEADFIIAGHKRPAIIFETSLLSTPSLFDTSPGLTVFPAYLIAFSTFFPFFPLYDYD
jgi:hypothetical protein